MSRPGSRARRDPQTAEEWIRRVQRLAADASRLSAETATLHIPLCRDLAHVRAMIAPDDLRKTFAAASVELGLAAYNLRPFVRLLEEIADEVCRRPIPTRSEPKETAQDWLRRELDSLRPDEAQP